MEGQDGTCLFSAQTNECLGLSPVELQAEASWTFLKNSERWGTNGPTLGDKV